MTRGAESPFGGRLPKSFARTSRTGSVVGGSAADRAGAGPAFWRQSSYDSTSAIGTAGPGIIRIEQGRGTFVVRDLIDYPLTTRTRFREILGRQRLASSARMLKWSRAKPDERAVAALELSPGADVIVMDAAREVEGVRLSISTHICPADRFAHVPEHFAKTGSITEALQRCGVEDYHRRTTRISARLPTAEDARYLHHRETGRSLLPRV